MRQLKYPENHIGRKLSHIHWFKQDTCRGAFWLFIEVGLFLSIINGGPGGRLEIDSEQLMREYRQSPACKRHVMGG